MRKGQEGLDSRLQFELGLRLGQRPELGDLLLDPLRPCPCCFKS